MTDDQKASLFQWLPRVLADDATFLLRDKYDAFTAGGRNSGADLPSTYEDFVASEAEKGDTPAALDHQLDWLRSAGFATGLLDVSGNYALVAARLRASTGYQAPS